MDDTTSEDQVTFLKEQLAQKEKDLRLAAEIGKQLLETNNELSNQLESYSNEGSAEIEKLEQEKYALQLKLDQKVAMEKNYFEELEGLKSALKHKDEQFALQGEDHNSRVSEINKEVANLRSQLEVRDLKEKQLSDQASQLTQMLKDAQDQLEMKVNALNETSSEELAQLHMDNNSLQTDKVNLTRELSDTKHELQQVALQVETLKSRLVAKDEEVEEKMCQATSYYNALERSREENLELKMELDLIKMESQNMKKKGNSLFAEVEDRRIEAEKLLISLKVQCQSLKKENSLTKQHLHKLKMQMAALLQMSGGMAETSHMERLEQQLAQARCEVQTLSIQLQQYQKKEKSQTEQIILKAQGGGVDKNYAEFLQALLNSKEAEVGKVQEELDAKSMLLLAEREKLLQCERKLYTTEQQLTKIQGQGMKLHLRVEELQMKYEPDAMKMAGKIRKTRVEVIPLATHSDPAKEEEGKENKEVAGDNSGDTTEMEYEVKEPALVTSDRLNKLGKSCKSEKSGKSEKSSKSEILSQSDRRKPVARTDKLNTKRDLHDLPTVSQVYCPDVKKKKHVTLSDDVVVHEHEAVPYTEEAVEVFEDQATNVNRSKGTIKGRSTTLESVSMADENPENCKCQ